MIDDDLLSHVARIRRQRSDDALVEAKAAVRDLPKSIWGTISAFANTDGGTVILGLDEREDFQPAEGFTESVELRSSSSHILDHIAEDDREAALRRLNVLTSDSVPTFAGYVTLSPYPQQELPRLVVDVSVHPSTQKAQEGDVRFLDRQVCDGPIPLMVEDAVSLSLIHISEPTRH